MYLTDLLPTWEAVLFLPYPAKGRVAKEILGEPPSGNSKTRGGLDSVCSGWFSKTRDKRTVSLGSSPR